MRAMNGRKLKGIKGIMNDTEGRMVWFMWNVDALTGVCGYYMGEGMIYYSSFLLRCVLRSLSRISVDHRTSLVL